jgi:hypothetical protein
MAILKNLFARTVQDDIARGETRLAAAVQKLNDKRRAHRAAIDAAESDDDPSVAVAAQALAAAQQWHDGVKSALAEAQQRQREAQAAETAAAQERDAKRAASIKANVIKVAIQTADTAERRLQDYVESVAECLEAQAALLPYMPNTSEFYAQLGTARNTLAMCATWRLNDHMGMTNNTMIDAERARWSRYLPSTIWPVAP